eukprot:Gregarina_sp_Poly_1__749@NODE_117_length_13667_cov_177_395147_g104_i0_p3_GENE_NODE_117_length_13667_cov_177_395147_g104_i0NODE_117_length_13667_cov_177_395147_g104_i0_p3_ORF_typecomplete_len492_score91_67_NODE_117_length_13667_cov_177_395147_g104_i070148489
MTAAFWVLKATVLIGSHGFIGKIPTDTRHSYPPPLNTRVNRPATAPGNASSAAATQNQASAAKSIAVSQQSAAAAVKKDQTASKIATTPAGKLPMKTTAAKKPPPAVPKPPPLPPKPKIPATSLPSKQAKKARPKMPSKPVTGTPSTLRPSTSAPSATSTSTFTASTSARTSTSEFVSSRSLQMTTTSEMSAFVSSTASALPLMTTPRPLKLSTRTSLLDATSSTSTSPPINNQEAQMQAGEKRQEEKSVATIEAMEAKESEGAAQAQVHADAGNAITARTVENVNVGVMRDRDQAKAMQTTPAIDTPVSAPVATPVSPIPPTSMTPVAPAQPGFTSENVQHRPQPSVPETSLPSPQKSTSQITPSGAQKTVSAQPVSAQPVSAQAVSSRLAPLTPGAIITQSQPVVRRPGILSAGGMALGGGRPRLQTPAEAQLQLEKQLAESLAATAEQKEAQRSIKRRQSVDKAAEVLSSEACQRRTNNTLLGACPKT